MDFLETLTAILNHQEEIPGLPNDRLIAIDCPGNPINGRIVGKDFLAIARLQTLAIAEEEKCRMPEDAHFFENTAVAQKTNTAEVMASCLSAQEDGAKIVSMLECLITEIVRKLCPIENERCEVTYFAHPSGKVLWRDAPPVRCFD